jgi:GDPmannose 4,6-dehydratase
LAGFSSPLDSWDYPSEALHTNGFSVLTFLESIKNYSPKSKFFNACSAKIFSQKIEGAHTVNSSVDPSEPYGLGKYLGFQLINQYRNRYGLFACSGILYNHESHLKNENFVVYKICKNALKLKVGKIKKFDLYNLDSEIDFGDPRDYVRAMVLIMRQNKPEDMIISSNVSISIRDICLLVGDLLQIDNILDYVNVKDKNKKKIFPLRGDNTRLHEIGWTPKYSLKDTLTYMLENISITS